MTPGVVESNSSPSHSATNALKDPKKKRMLLIGGAGLAGFLLLKHGNNQASGQSTGSTADQLQNQADALTAAETAFGASNPPGGYSTPVSSPGGDIISKGKAPGVNVKVVVPGGGGHRHGHGHGKGYGHGHGHGKGKGKHPNLGHKHKHPPKEPPHKGKHHAHHNQTAKVESVRGAGSGVTIRGREFPGAISHFTTGVRRTGNGRTAQVVKVNYGGHTDTHLIHSDGTWTDHPRGSNPPSRGLPSAARRSTPPRRPVRA